MFKNVWQPTLYFTNLKPQVEKFKLNVIGVMYGHQMLDYQQAIDFPYLFKRC